MSTITADEAAAILGVSKRMVYDLAAPHGPIPCARYSAKCVRFESQDVEAYKAQCQHTSIKQKIVGSLTSTRLSTAGESELQKLYRQAGAVPRPKPSTKQKPTSSMPLRLVRPKNA